MRPRLRPSTGRERGSRTRQGDELTEEIRARWTADRTTDARIGMRFRNWSPGELTRTRVFARPDVTRAGSARHAE